MKQSFRSKLASYSFEFLSIFVAVVSAFALNNWNDNRRSAQSENKILTGIYNGLEKDLGDVRENMMGHRNGIAACKYFRSAVVGEPVDPDSLMQYYFTLTRSFLSIQNVAGYETLKSKGLEVIQDDSLRHQIISLYEFDYAILRKMEETYPELQFQTEYFHSVNNILAPYLHFDTANKTVTLQQLDVLSEADRNRLLVYLWKIQFNRIYMVSLYKRVEASIEGLHEAIEQQL